MEFKDHQYEYQEVRFYRVNITRMEFKVIKHRDLWNVNFGVNITRMEFKEVPYKDKMNEFK